jgi:hypothetical protein
VIGGTGAQGLPVVHGVLPLVPVALICTHELTTNLAQPYLPPRNTPFAF